MGDKRFGRSIASKRVLSPPSLPCSLFGRVALSVGLSLLVVSGGCGGHSSSSGTSSAQFTADLKATNAVAAYLSTKTTLGRTDLATAALAYLQSDPAFVRSGMSSDGTVWGELKDGVLYALETNDPTFDMQQGGTPAAMPKVRPAIKLKPHVAAGEVPGGPHAYVFDAYPANCLSPASTIADELTAAGYSVTKGTGTLDEWKSVSDAAVLFNSSHGARIDIDGTSTFYQQTGQEPVQSDSSWAKPLLDSHVLMIDGIANPAQPLARGQDIPCPVVNRYTFQASYLTNSRMFTSNSFFWDECCSGTSPAGRNFVSSLQSKNGLSVFAGWSQPVVILDANESSSFFFDRALGLNQFPPVDPTSPPPNDWNSIWGIMKSNNCSSNSAEPLTQSDPSLNVGHENEPGFGVGLC